MPVLKLNSDNVLEITNVTDDITDTVLTSATVTVTIKDAGGNNVSGISWPLTLGHVGAGTYRVTMEDAAVLSVYQTYKATYIVDNGVNQRREKCVEYTVECS